MQLDSSAILQSLEAQHGLLIERAKGIYSFSHLTFHEYFTAREIVFNSNSLETTLKELASFVTQKQWREVFLLIAEMLNNANLLLSPMKQNIDRLLAKSERLQEFLQYVRLRAASLEFSCFKPAAVRAFYFDIDFDIDEQGETVDDEIKLVANKAREVAKSRHHIGKEWKFTPQEKERLRQY